MTSLIASIVATLPIISFVIYVGLEKKFVNNQKIFWLLYIAGGVLSYFIGIINSFFLDLFFQGNFNFENVPYLAFIEELFKFTVVYFFIRKSFYKYSLFNSFFFGMAVALGFATVENIGYVIFYKEQWVYVSIIRILLTVPMHAITGGIIAMFLYTYLHRGKEIEYNVYGVGIGVLIHTSFNFFALYNSFFSNAIMALIVGAGVYIIFYSYKKLLSLESIIDSRKDSETPEKIKTEFTTKPKTESFSIVSKEKGKKDFEIISRKKK